MPPPPIEKGPRISIVVPVYKVEKYLRECVESVLAQSFRDFELILVDDGSPDKSGEICDELAKKDSRIRVFHQENGGVASARRFGMEQARAEWICFVDSDDVLTKNSLQDLFDEADENTDWVQGMACGFKDEEKPNICPQVADKSVRTFDLVGLMENMLLVHRPPWGKIVRRRLFSPGVMDIPRDMCYGDDVLANLRLINNGPRNPKEISNVVYCQRSQGDSITRSCVPSENYTMRSAKLFFAEIKKIPVEDRRRVECALARYLLFFACVPLKWGFPARDHIELAKLVRPAIGKSLACLFVYLCLRFNCMCIGRIGAKFFFLLKGKKLDVEKIKILE